MSCHILAHAKWRFPIAHTLLVNSNFSVVYEDLMRRTFMFGRCLWLRQNVSFHHHPRDEVKAADTSLFVVATVGLLTIGVGVRRLGW